MWSVPDVNHVSGTDHLTLVARGGIEPPTQGFSTPLLDSTSLFSQKVHPTIGKLCAQNFLGCLYGIDLVELF